MGKIMYDDRPYSGSFNKAVNVQYDNSNSGLNSQNVQAAIEEVIRRLFSFKPSSVVNALNFTTNGEKTYTIPANGVISYYAFKNWNDTSDYLAFTITQGGVTRAYYQLGKNTVSNQKVQSEILVTKGAVLTVTVIGIENNNYSGVGIQFTPFEI